MNAQRMTHNCQTCGKRFNVPEGVTFNELHALRLMYIRGSYWHVPCARISKVGTGIDVDVKAGGELLEV